jgi:hypothetical protein
LTRTFPLYHAMSILQIVICFPKSSCTHEFRPKFDHLLLRSPSATFEGDSPDWVPLAFMEEIESLPHGAAAVVTDDD